MNPLTKNVELYMMNKNMNKCFDREEYIRSLFREDTSLAERVSRVMQMEGSSGAGSLNNAVRGFGWHRYEPVESIPDIV